MGRLIVQPPDMNPLADPLIARATFVDFRDQRKFERCPIRGSALMSRNVDVALASAKERHSRDTPLMCLGAWVMREPLSRGSS